MNLTTRTFPGQSCIWSIITTLPTTRDVTSATANINIPIHTQYSGTASGSATTFQSIKGAKGEVSIARNAAGASLAVGSTAGTTTGISGFTSGSAQLSSSIVKSLFTSQNRTASTAYVYAADKSFAFTEIYTKNGSTMSSSVKYNGSSTYEQATQLLFKIPPALSASNALTVDTPSFVIANVTNGSVTINASGTAAYFDGYISKLAVTVGSRTVEKTLTESQSSSTGALLASHTLTIPLTEAGTFTPVVSVTCSRGQTKTKKLEPITVAPYVTPSVSCSIQRCDSTGVPDEETGTYGLITGQFTYTGNPLYLETPTLAVTDGTTAQTASVTWYTAWDATNGVSDPVNWTDYQPTSPVTLYGLMSNTGGFDEAKSYRITLTPNDDYNAGNPTTGTLDGAFYTVDFLAGGHGVAFGKLATNQGFEVAMPAVFEEDTAFEQDVDVTGTVSADRASITTDIDIEVSTTDALYTALQNIGWSLTNSLKALLTQIVNRLAPTKETFTVSVTSAISSANQNNQYFALTGEVSLCLNLWSVNGVSAIGNVLPVTIPEKYRPKTEAIGQAILTASSAAGQAPRVEQIIVRPSGQIYVSNFLSSYSTAKGFWIWATYNIN